MFRTNRFHSSIHKRFDGKPGMRRSACLGLAAFLLSLLSGCCQPVSPSEESSQPIYNPVQMNYTISGKTYANLFEYAFSPNRDYLIYVASQLNENPEAWLYNRNTGNHFQLTENDYFIESQVCVDDSANRAFILTENSNSTSKVFCNETLIVENGLLNRSLCFWKNQLFFASWDISSRTSQLCLYDIVSGKTEILANLPIATGSSVAAGDVILLEAYDILNDADIVLSLRPEEAGETVIEEIGNSDSFLRLYDGEIYVEQVSGDPNAIYLLKVHGTL